MTENILDWDELPMNYLSDDEDEDEEERTRRRNNVCLVAAEHPWHQPTEEFPCESRHNSYFTGWCLCRDESEKRLRRMERRIKVLEDLITKT